MLQTKHKYLVFTCTSSSLSLREPRLTNMKSIILAAVAAPFIAAPAIAGPYVNIESNASFTGTDYNATTTEFHVGYEGDFSDNAGYYAQLGPALVSVDGEDRTTELSGKVGADVALSDNLSAYGEIAFVTQDEGNFDEDLNVGTKLGLKFVF